MRRVFLALSFFLLCSMGFEARSQFNRDYFYWMGRNLMLDDRYEAAIETLNILINVDKNVYEAYFLRGVAKFNLDDLLGAEQDFTMAIDQNPVYTMAYNARAITRSRLGNYDDALKDFHEAISLRPDLPGPYYSRGVTYLMSGQDEKAIEDFDQYIRQESRSADAYLNRGLAYLNLQDTVRAYHEFDTAVRTNRYDPLSYTRRGALYMMQDRYDEALADFDKSIECDSTYLPAYFNRAIVYNNLNRPVHALADLDRVIALDSTSSLAYFNRAIMRSQIGDYNSALDDYNKVAVYSPSNVLVYYNRALLYSQLGNFQAAADDYTRAIELYPDFANAYLNRANVRYMLRDNRGARSDRNVAETKIAEYRANLRDSTFSYSAYADTSRKFNQLLSFDTKMSGNQFSRVGDREEDIAMMPLFRFSFVNATGETISDIRRYDSREMEVFSREIDNPYLRFTMRDSDISADSLIVMDRRLERDILTTPENWLLLFERGITQSLIKQYTSSVNSYSAAIERNPTNPFLYINRSTTRSEMIDFISSIDNTYQRISIDIDPASRLKNSSSRTYNYEEAIADLNKAVKLLPDFPYTYYNRGNLHALSGRLPEAFDDYTEAIGLYPNFAEAYFNRGLVQLYMKDTRKGLLDISKAGELGITDAYVILRRYSDFEQEE